MTLPALRKRIASEPVITADLSAQWPAPVNDPPNVPTTNTFIGTLKSVMAGFFGKANPPSYTASAQVDVNGNALYRYHEGDLFTPGTQNYVFEYPFELTPLTPIWGAAFLRRPNTFSPVQPPVQMVDKTIVVNGVGGVIAGQFAFQPLETENQ